MTRTIITPAGKLAVMSAEHEKQLSEYFDGKRKTFNLPIDQPGTDFQQLVWRKCIKIPYGETRTYGQLAESIGKPTAARAVGAALGQNKLWVVVPCHRVVGANGGLTGFAGGLDMKSWLLAFERGEQLT